MTHRLDRTAAFKQSPVSVVTRASTTPAENECYFAAGLRQSTSLRPKLQPVFPYLPPNFNFVSPIHHYFENILATFFEVCPHNKIVELHQGLPLLDSHI